MYMYMYPDVTLSVCCTLHFDTPTNTITYMSSNLRLIRPRFFSIGKYVVHSMYVDISMLLGYLAFSPAVTQSSDSILAVVRLLSCLAHADAISPHGTAASSSSYSFIMLVERTVKLADKILPPFVAVASTNCDRHVSPDDFYP